MKVADKVCVVTGGASGIGRALCQRFAAEGAAGVVVVDRDADGAEAVAADVSGIAISCDLGDENDVNAMVAAATSHFGRIDLLVNNAGIANDQDFLDGSLDPWRAQWAVNVMAHVYTARAVLPAMLERAEGYLLHTTSMAGILNSPGAAAYGATKHAAVGLAEWLSMTYQRRGIRVYMLAPLGVDTPMLDATPPALRAASGQTRTPEEVAQAVIEGFENEQFLILTDPMAANWIERKSANLEGWLEGMRRIQDNS